MNDIKKYKDYLLSVIKPWAKPASGGKVINCRCFYCSDSTNPSKGHFYIGIPQSEQDPSWYKCHKCNAKGIVSGKKLIEWGIFDNDINIMLSKINSNIPHSFIYNTDVLNIKYDYITKDDLTEFKLNYINKRLGMQLRILDCIKMKIVLNISDIINRNRLELTRDKRIVDQLDKNFIGFLSYDNAFLNMRNLEVSQIHESINKRYINYNVMQREDNTCKFYMIPCVIDLADVSPVDIHISEGPFDILSIYRLRSQYRSIFVAVGGKGYSGVINFLLQLCKLPTINLHIYADNDTTDDMYIRIHEKIKALGITTYIHRNMYQGEKDFGVPMGRINESIRKLI